MLDGQCPLDTLIANTIRLRQKYEQKQKEKHSKQTETRYWIDAQNTKTRIYSVSEFVACARAKLFYIPRYVCAKRKRRSSMPNHAFQHVLEIMMCDDGT